MFMTFVRTSHGVYIYALTHPVSVAASLSGEDLQRFNLHYVKTKKLFSECIVQKGDKEKMKEIEQRLRHCLKLCTSIICFSMIQEKCHYDQISYILNPRGRQLDDFVYEISNISGFYLYFINIFIFK